jgi:hypothetical protein
MLEKEIPRRDFIRYYLVGAGALILASCARRKELPQPQVTVEVTPTLEPTVAPTEVGVPEPIVGFPESLDKGQIIDVEDLDEFMPKLVQAERAYLDKNGWPQDQYLSITGNVFPGQGVMPDQLLVSFMKYDYNKDHLLFTYWGKIRMQDGNISYLVGIPGVEIDKTTNKPYENGERLLHFAFNFNDSKKFYESLGKSDIYNKRLSPEAVFNAYKNNLAVGDIDALVYIEENLMNDEADKYFFLKIKDKIAQLVETAQKKKTDQELIPIEEELETYPIPIYQFAY